jgi:hypothetical protein
MHSAASMRDLVILLHANSTCRTMTHENAFSIVNMTSTCEDPKRA